MKFTLTPKMLLYQQTTATADSIIQNQKRRGRLPATNPIIGLPRLQQNQKHLKKVLRQFRQCL